MSARGVLGFAGRNPLLTGAALLALWLWWRKGHKDGTGPGDQGANQYPPAPPPADCQPFIDADGLLNIPICNAYGSPE